MVSAAGFPSQQKWKVNYVVMQEPLNKSEKGIKRIIKIDGIIIYRPKLINLNGLTNNKISSLRFIIKLEASGNKLRNSWTTGTLIIHPFRTDNAVKNHFYSTLRRSLRRINKFYGFKNSTNQMKNLKPSTLTFLVEKSNESP
jgi:hypothetical protein